MSTPLSTQWTTTGVMATTTLKPFILETTSPPPSNSTTTNNSPVTIMQISNILFYGYFTFVPLTSFIFLLRFYYLMQKVRGKLSFQLTVHLFLWVVCTISSFIYATPILLSLIFDSFVEENLFLIMVRGSLNLASLESIQLSTSFLILNRIQAILMPSIAMSKYRHYLQYMTIGVFSLSFFVVFVIAFQRGYAPMAGNGTGCVGFACRMLGQLDDLSMYKMIIGLINIGFGSFFVFLYFRYARKSAIRRENRKNFAVLLIIITEFLFTVTPNALYIFTSNAIIPVLGIRIATTLAIGYSTDAAVTTIVYFYTWNKIIRPCKVAPTVTVLNGNPNQQNASTDPTNNNS